MKRLNIRKARNPEDIFEQIHEGLQLASSDMWGFVVRIEDGDWSYGVRDSETNIVLDSMAKRLRGMRKDVQDILRDMRFIEGDIERLNNLAWEV